MAMWTGQDETRAPSPGFEGPPPPTLGGFVADVLFGFILAVLVAMFVPLLPRGTITATTFPLGLLGCLVLAMLRPGGTLRRVFRGRAR